MQIGKSFLKGLLQTAVHIAGDLAHSIQKTHPGVLISNVQFKAFRKFIYTRLSGLQCRKGRYLQNGSHADGKNGIQCDPAKIGKEFSEAVPLADLVTYKDQGNKNTGKKADVVVGKDLQKQRQSVQDKLFFPQQ